MSAIWMFFLGAACLVAGAVMVFSYWRRNQVQRWNQMLGGEEKTAGEPEDEKREEGEPVPEKTKLLLMAVPTAEEVGGDHTVFCATPVPSPKDAGRRLLEAVPPDGVVKREGNQAGFFPPIPRDEAVAPQEPADRKTVFLPGLGNHTDQPTKPKPS